MSIVLLSAAFTRLDLSSPLESNKHENPYRVSSRPVIFLSLSPTMAWRSPCRPLPIRHVHHHQLSHWPPPRMICSGASCVSMVWSPRISSHVNIIGRLLSQPHHPTHLPFVFLLPRLPHLPCIYRHTHIRCVDAVQAPFWVGARASLCFLGLSLTLCTPPPPRTRYIQQIEQRAL